MTDVPEPRLSLTRVEVDAVLTAFQPADWTRAEAIAAALCGGLTGWTPDDLLQEAMTKLLEGDRTWPAGVHPLVVLKTAMRSIASNARKHNEASPVDEAVVLDPTTELDSEVTPKAHGRVTVTPEDKTSGKQQLVAVYAIVSGDEDLEMLVMAWADGLRGEDARQELGWDGKKYDAARNRLLRRLKAVDPDRRPK
jgi:DNA-directed RNA polymerase specialized sigma24 family protein